MHFKLFSMKRKKSLSALRAVGHAAAPAHTPHRFVFRQAALGSSTACDEPSRQPQAAVQPQQAARRSAPQRSKKAKAAQVSCLLGQFLS